MPGTRKGRCVLRSVARGGLGRLANPTSASARGTGTTGSEADRRWWCTADESLPFYLIFRLPLVELNRAQATALLLPGPTAGTSNAHLSLSADISFVESNKQAVAQQQLMQQQQQHSLSSHPSSSVPQLSQPHPFPQLTGAPRRRSSLGPNPPSTSTSASSTTSLPATLRTNLPPQPQHRSDPPPTPSPFPQTRKADVGFGEAVGVPLTSYTFGADGGKGGMGTSKGKGRETDQAWVGREEGGGWVGVWRFGAEVGELRSRRGKRGRPVA